MKLRKHGNSLVISIPSQITKILRWKEGCELEVVREGVRVVVQRIEGEDFGEEGTGHEKRKRR